MIDETSIMLRVLSEHADHEKWANAPFGKIRQIPNTKVGDVGQDFLEAVCRELNLDYEFPLNKKGGRAKQSPWDIMIQGKRFELKTASEDSKGKFQFNHIRYTRDYDALVCIGISPSEIFFELWSKGEVATGKAGRLVSMEKGGSISHKLSKKVEDLRPIDGFAERLTEFIENFTY